MIRPLASADRFGSGRKALTLREAALAVRERLQALMSPSAPEVVSPEPAPTGPPPKSLEQFPEQSPQQDLDEDSVTAKITQTKLLSMLGTAQSANESFKYRSKATITQNKLPVIIPPIDITLNASGPSKG